MATLEEYLADRKQYPDDQKIVLADGLETTLGELRDQGFFRKQDYTHKTNAVAREREALQREKAEWEQSKTAAEAELARLAEQALQRAATVQRQNPDATVDEVDAYIAKDPVSQRLLRQIEAANKRASDAEAKATKAAEENAKQQQWYWQDLHQRALAAMKPQMDELGITPDEVVTFAKQSNIPRIDWAFDLLAKDKRIEVATKKAAEEAEKRAYERARQELAAPAQLPQRRLAPVLPQDQPQTFEDAKLAAARDPEILATIEGFGLDRV